MAYGSLCSMWFAAKWNEIDGLLDWWPWNATPHHTVARHTPLSNMSGQQVKELERDMLDILRA
jgi:hypothetical protein